MSRFRFPVYMDKGRYPLLQEKCRHRKISVSALYRDVAELVIADGPEAEKLFRMLRPYARPYGATPSKKSPPLL